MGDIIQGRILIKEIGILVGSYIIVSLDSFRLKPMPSSLSLLH